MCFIPRWPHNGVQFIKQFKISRSEFRHWRGLLFAIIRRKHVIKMLWRKIYVSFADTHATSTSVFINALREFLGKFPLLFGFFFLLLHTRFSTPLLHKHCARWEHARDNAEALCCNYDFEKWFSAVLLVIGCATYFRTWKAQSSLKIQLESAIRSQTSFRSYQIFPATAESFSITASFLYAAIISNNSPGTPNKSKWTFSLVILASNFSAENWVNESREESRTRSPARVHASNDWWKIMFNFHLTLLAASHTKSGVWGQKGKVGFEESSGKGKVR